MAVLRGPGVGCYSGQRETARTLGRRRQDMNRTIILVASLILLGSAAVYFSRFHAPPERPRAPRAEASREPTPTLPPVDASSARDDSPERPAAAPDEDARPPVERAVATVSERAGDPERRSAALALARRCATELSDDCDLLHPSAEQLQEMARCGTVQFDFPPDLLSAPEPFRWDEAQLREVGLSASEVERAQTAAAAFQGELRAQLGAIYRDQFGAPPGPDEATIPALLRALQGAEDPQARQETQKQVAEARAGGRALEAPSKSPTERRLRLLFDLGDRLEQRLAGAVGLDRAQLLRATRDGWGGKSVYSGSCPDGGV